MDLEFNLKVNKIKEKINIVEVIGKYLTLIHKGNNFWAICPFHEDSNPSLSISQEKQIYKCFSCGEQGNVFIFLQKYKNLTFITALKEAAAIVKLNLKDFDLDLSENDYEKQENPIKLINKLAMNFFSYQLLTDIGQEPLNYLKTRNITPENIKDFNIGYAPGKNNLLAYLRAQNCQDNDIIKAGLAKITKHDQIHDAFSNRIIFAIKDEAGSCVGFSSRTYDQQDKSYKYLNSSETIFFKKSKILYNFDNANRFIKKGDVLYLVEGFMDTIALSNKNIKNCVSLMGTNLTKDHIILLKKITNNIVVFLDGDQPGKLASLKIANSLLLNNFAVKIVNNETKFDPDELINKFSNQFELIIKNHIHPFEFAINFFLTQYDLKKDVYQLNEFIKALIPTWNTIHNLVSKKFYLDMLVKITNLSESTLSQILAPTKVDIKIEHFINGKNFKLPSKNKFDEAQKQLIFLVLLSRDVYLTLENQKFIFPNSNYMNLYFLISQKYQDQAVKKIEFADILAELKHNYLFEIVQEIVNQYQNQKFDLKPRIIIDYLKIINNELIEHEIKIINEKIKFEINVDNKIQFLKKISLLKSKIKQ